MTPLDIQAILGYAVMVLVVCIAKSEWAWDVPAVIESRGKFI